MRLSGVFGEALQEGKSEGSGLAGAGLGDAQEVAAFRVVDFMVEPEYADGHVGVVGAAALAGVLNSHGNQAQHGLDQGICKTLFEIQGFGGNGLLRFSLDAGGNAGDQQCGCKT